MRVRHQLTQENPLNMVWCCADNCPCTGVNVGCSFVNSSSKLLVSALPFCKVPPFQYIMRPSQWSGLRLWGSMEGVYAC